MRGKMKAGSMRNPEFEALHIDTIKRVEKMVIDLLDTMESFEDKREYALKALRELKLARRHIKTKLAKEVL